MSENTAVASDAVPDHGTAMAPPPSTRSPHQHGREAPGEGKTRHERAGGAEQKPGAPLAIHDCGAGPVTRDVQGSKADCTTAGGVVGPCVDVDVQEGGKGHAAAHAVDRIGHRATGVLGASTGGAVGAVGSDVQGELRHLKPSPAVQTVTARTSRNAITTVALLQSP
jgi:hypothetical protein